MSATASLDICGWLCELPSAPMSVTMLVSTSKPAPSRVTSLATIRSSPLRLSLARALASRSSVSAANPTSRRAPFFAARRGISSAIDSISSRSPRASFLILPRAGFAGRKSATAAAITSVVDHGKLLDVCASIAAAVTVSIRSTPYGVASADGPATIRTAAPRRHAARAIANPILPDERLVTNRTGSIGSCVGPAVTRTFSPARSCVESILSISATTIAGSGRRPLPS